MDYEDFFEEPDEDNQIFWIYVENGKPKGDPYIQENLKDKIEDFENNIPDNMKRFYPSVEPIIDTPYKKVLGSSYEVYDDAVYHVYHIQEMTNHERSILQKNYLQWWKENYDYKGWTFNEYYCRYFPPFPEPADSNTYIWDNNTENWKQVTDSNTTQP